MCISAAVHVDVDSVKWSHDIVTNCDGRQRLLHGNQPVATLGKKKHWMKLKNNTGKELGKNQKSLLLFVRPQRIFLIGRWWGAGFCLKLSNLANRNRPSFFVPLCFVISRLFRLPPSLSVCSPNAHLSLSKKNLLFVKQTKKLVFSVPFTNLSSFIPYPDYELGIFSTIFYLAISISQHSSILTFQAVLSYQSQDNPNFGNLPTLENPKWSSKTHTLFTTDKCRTNSLRLVTRRAENGKNLRIGLWLKKCAETVGLVVHPLGLHYDLFAV